MNAEDTDAGKQRPAPKRISRLLAAFAFVMMIPFPLLCLSSLHGMSLWIISGRSTWLPIFTAFMLGCLSFFSGYLLYLGNYYGRMASLVFLFSNLVTWIMTICDVWYSSGFAFVGTFRFIILGIVVALVCYCIASPNLRNMYAINSRSRPIRVIPLPVWQKAVLLVWGAIIIGWLLFVSFSSIQLMRTQFVTYRVIDEKSENTAFTVTLNTHTFIIPKPAKARLVNTESRSTTYANTRVLSFADSNSYSATSFTVDYFEGNKTPTSPQSFANQNSTLKSIMDQIGSPLKVVAESPNFIIRYDDGGLFLRGKLCDAQLLMRGQLLTLRMTSRSWNSSYPGMVVAMQEWIEKIVAANDIHQ